MQTEITFILNHQIIRTKLNPATVLLDFIRKKESLTGTKEVCKEGDCGACAVLLGAIIDNRIEYKTINSCLFPIEKVNGKHVVTIEGLNSKDLNPIQKSFLDEGASQCGFCTPGFIISFTGYLLNSQEFNLEKAINAVAGNICRCTGYHSIIRSLKKVGDEFGKIDTEMLINLGIVPKYFLNIPKDLKGLNQQKSHITNENFNQIIAGGTDLFVQRPDELLHKKNIFSENLIPPGIKIESSQIVISGSATVSDLQIFLESQSHIIELNKLFKLFASLPIRNSATIAGNLINASPIADLTITLLAFDSELLLRNRAGNNKSIQLKNFYKGYKTLAKEENEYIKEIKFDLPKKYSKINFEKVSKRTHLDIASVNTAIYLDINSSTIIDAHLSAGGVAPIPLLLHKTSEFLIGKTVSNDLIQKSVKIAGSEISPISDIRGSAKYKSLLLQQLIKSHFMELFPQLVTPEVLA